MEKETRQQKYDKQFDKITARLPIGTLDRIKNIGYMPGELAKIAIMDYLEKVEKKC